MIKRYLQFIKEQQLSLFPMDEVMKPVEEVKTYRLEDDKIEELFVCAVLRLPPPINAYLPFA